MCNSLIYDALQVFGGAGFTEDYDIARLYRDARITNLYDGTSQIQINAAIGGISAGMTAKGLFREYLDDWFAKTDASDLLAGLRATFEEVVETYKALPNADLKAELSLEVCNSAVRILIGLYMEQTAAKLKDADQREERLQLAREFNIDSEAILSGNLIRLKRGAEASAPALAAIG